MDTIRLLVQNLVIIVVLAVILEMLLPRGEMRRYTQMVLGLMVIVSVIQAVNGLSGGGLFREIEGYAWREESNGAKALNIMDKGKEIDRENRQRAMEYYKSGIEKQVAGLAGLDGRIKLSGAEVILQDDPSKKDYGTIKGINLVIGDEKEDSRKIKPVDKISVSAGQENSGGISGSGIKPAEKEAAMSAAEKVAGFYNLAPDQVKIIYK